MTVNELIEALKDTGDEKWRDFATIRVVMDETQDEFCDTCPEVEFTPDRFDVKQTLRTVDIHI